VAPFSIRPCNCVLISAAVIFSTLTPASLPKSYRAHTLASTPEHSLIRIGKVGLSFFIAVYVVLIKSLWEMDGGVWGGGGGRSQGTWNDSLVDRLICVSVYDGNGVL